MSGGRVELGIGAGWFESEHLAYAIPFPPLGERFDRLTEQLHILTGLWGTPVGDTFDYAGTHYTVKDSPALPNKRARHASLVTAAIMKQQPGLSTVAISIRYKPVITWWISGHTLAYFPWLRPKRWGSLLNGRSLTALGEQKEAPVLTQRNIINGLR
jgi:hypothetical protein